VPAHLCQGRGRLIYCTSARGLAPVSRTCITPGRKRPTRRTYVTLGVEKKKNKKEEEHTCSLLPIAFSSLDDPTCSA